MTKLVNIKFACGCQYTNVEDPSSEVSHIDRDGRIRLCVYDSECDTMMKPKNGEETADCLYGCKCKRKAKRKATKCYPTCEFDRSRPLFTQFRNVITCYGTIEERE